MQSNLPSRSRFKPSTSCHMIWINTNMTSSNTNNQPNTAYQLTTGSQLQPSEPGVKQEPSLSVIAQTATSTATSTPSHIPFIVTTTTCVTAIRLIVNNILVNAKGPQREIFMMIMGTNVCKVRASDANQTTEYRIRFFAG